MEKLKILKKIFNFLLTNGTKYVILNPEEKKENKKMKVIMVNDSIVSLENVRRVDRERASNKKEPHCIVVYYTNSASESIYFNNDSLVDFNSTFENIFHRLTED